MAKLHLLKLCVGIDSVAHLQDHRARQSARLRESGEEDLSTHVTRMFPRRAAELLAGGSLYWVIRGAIRARQPILRLDAVTGKDGIRRCAIVMAPRIIPTRTAPRRPFQGWRYLEPENAPPDLPAERQAEDDLPEALQLALAEIGLR